MVDWSSYSSGDCFLIAEAGVAHFGSVEKALALVDVAVDAKVDAIKFQIFQSDALFSSLSLDWKKRLSSRMLSAADYRTVKQYCDEKGIRFFATAHDEVSLEALLKLGVDLLKIGSGEVGNLGYINTILETGIPTIISTGMYTRKQIDTLISSIGDAQENVCLLHCVTEYPVPEKRVNLARMMELQNIYSGKVGYSDHTAGTQASLCAIALGASVIEKHISIDFGVPDAQDWKVSLNSGELKTFVKDARLFEILRKSYRDDLSYQGKPNFELDDYQKASASWAGKSAFFRSDLSAGHRLVLADLEFKRPGVGINYTECKKIIGLTLLDDVKAGDLLTIESLR